MSNTKENDMEIETQLETKAGIPPDALVTHGDMMRLFEDFKQTNDKRLASQKRGGDVLLEEKMARNNAAITAHHRQTDDINDKSPRPPLSGEKPALTHDQRE